MAIDEERPIDEIIRDTLIQNGDPIVPLEFEEESPFSPESQALTNMIKWANKSHMLCEVAEAFINELKAGTGVIEATRRALYEWDC